MSSVRAVCIDLGGTLLRVNPSVGAVYAQTAARFGFTVSAEEVEDNFSRAWNASLGRSSAREYRCSDEILREEWRQIVGDSFAGQLSPEKFDSIFEELYAHFASAKAWVLAPGARECLVYLREKGLRLGVLSNWDSRFLTTLEELGIADAFDEFIVSHAVGHEKPHPKIFDAALRRLGSRPQQTLHVGDSWDADIRPARGLGWRTLWIAPESRRAAERDAGAGAESFAAFSRAAWERLLARDVSQTQK